jgi:hypothetical protein
MTRRIERAMALLRHGGLSVIEVCFAVSCKSLGISVLASPSWAVAKQVAKPIRNREARVTEPQLE